MKDRIKQLMELKQMTQQSFAEYIEMSPASLSSIFNGRTKPTLNIVEAIKRKFPDISMEWLLFGTGPMLMSNSALSDTTTAGLSTSGNQSASTAATDNVSNKDNSPSPTPTNHTASQSSRQSEQKDSNQACDPAGSPNATHPEVIRQEIKYIDKPQRKITEIRVYFDDLTFESFVPAK